MTDETRDTDDALVGDVFEEEDGTDPLVAARMLLDDAASLPLDQRDAVFQQVHEVVTDELRQLDQG